jgi:hypothetical protein
MSENGKSDTRGNDEAARRPLRRICRTPHDGGGLEQMVVVALALSRPY